MEEIVLIHTKRGLGYRRGLVFYLWVGMDRTRTWDITRNLQPRVVSTSSKRLKYLVRLKSNGLVSKREFFKQAH